MQIETVRRARWDARVIQSISAVFGGPLARSSTTRDDQCVVARWWLGERCDTESHAAAHRDCAVFGGRDQLDAVGAWNLE